MDASLWCETLHEKCWKLWNCTEMWSLALLEHCLSMTTSRITITLWRGERHHIWNRQFICHIWMGYKIVVQCNSDLSFVYSVYLCTQSQCECSVQDKGALHSISWGVIHSSQDQMTSSERATTVLDLLPLLSLKALWIYDIVTSTVLYCSEVEILCYCTLEVFLDIFTVSITADFYLTTFSEENGYFYSITNQISILVSY